MPAFPFTRLIWASVVASVLLSSRVAAEVIVLYGHSSPVQELLKSSPNQICPRDTNDITSTSFPWTHHPTCIGVENQTICVYTNALFANGRGISFITTPEVATTYVLESFSHEDQEDRGEQSYEARETSDKGLGLFAASTSSSKDDSDSESNIEAGDSLMIKHPILIMSKALLSEDLRVVREWLLEVAIGQLPVKTQETVKRLAKSRGGKGFGGELDDLVGTNGMGMLLGSVGHVGVVPEAARINHACRPNAFYRFDDYTLLLDVFALKDIEPGEEITFSYGYSRHPHATRQSLLKENWGFTCKCSLCTANTTTISASDSRLTEIADIKKVLPSGFDAIPQLLAMLPRLIKLMDEEELLIERPMYEEILAYSWSTMGIEHRARYWAGRAKRGWEIVAGRRSHEARRTWDLERDVRGHGTWMTWDKDPWDDSVWEEDEGHHDHPGMHDHVH